MDTAISADKYAQIIKRLRAREVTNRCPMCGNAGLTLQNRYAISPTATATILTLGAEATLFISAVLVCGNCGFESRHNLHTLEIEP